MTTLAKGLAVMRAFAGDRATMTLSETARVADLTLYLRQHHAERDLAALGRLVAPSADQRPGGAS